MRVKLRELKKVNWERNNQDICLNSRDADVIIKYPLKENEFEIQYYLYHNLLFYCAQLDNSCEIKAEVTVYIDQNIQMRFDLMLFDHQQPVCGIEIKRNTYFTNPDHSKKQLIKYKMFERLSSIPVLYCYGMKQADEIILKVRKLLNNNYEK